MLLRSMPDLSNPEFRSWFYSKWGRENCIVWGRSRHAEYAAIPQTLSIKAAWGGAETYRIDNRVVTVDDDNFLILNHQRTYSSLISASVPVESFAIFFRPGLAETVRASLATSAEHALERGSEDERRMVEFSETLQPHDSAVSPVLRYIKAHLARGLDDEEWYEEQYHFLLERMLAHHRGVRERIAALPLARASTRREIYRRVALATDYMHAHYRRKLDLAELARIACLSKYHLLRLFNEVHGITPFLYLQRKRAHAALRLLSTTDLTTEQIAGMVGFSNRSSVFRQVRRWTGYSPRQVRARPAKTD